ncbi:MAG: ribonuclease HII [Actinomycetia bacterium]|nr:ribonuclease HII [Actinomycetes bacterium]
MARASSRLRPSLRAHAPGTSFEQERWKRGDSAVVGIDEVGKGAWAGPLTVGAVVIPVDRRIYKIRDSKQLTSAEREVMAIRIKDWALHWSVGHASAAECDELGMSDAQRLATARTLNALGVMPDHALIDGNWDFVEKIDTTTIVKGDARSLSIAAASIVAKVTRDAIMREAARTYPWFAFESNKGYPCHRQRAALELLGPSTIHRRSWVYMENLAWDGIEECRTEPQPMSLF